MHKDELPELHEQMVIIKDYLSARDCVGSSLFGSYDELAVKPFYIYKSKNEHKHAVFMLDNALMTAMSDGEFSSAGHIGKHMEELADDVEGKI